MKIIIDTDTLPQWLTSNAKYLAWWLDLQLAGGNRISLRKRFEKWSRIEGAKSVWEIRNFFEKLKLSGLSKNDEKTASRTNSAQIPHKFRTNSAQIPHTEQIENETVKTLSRTNSAQIPHKTRTKLAQNSHKTQNPTLINMRALDSINISCQESHSDSHIFNSPFPFSPTDGETETSLFPEIEEEKKREEPKRKKKPNGFLPPTEEEVAAYIREKGYDVDAFTFVNFYGAKGWKIGKNDMKDWKKAVATWHRSRKTNGNGNSTNIYDKRRSTDVTATSAEDYKTRF